jgi:hypothetical protein
VFVGEDTQTGDVMLGVVGGDRRYRRSKSRGATHKPLGREMIVGCRAGDVDYTTSL